MTNEVKRIEGAFNADNATILAAINVQLDLIDTAGGTMVAYAESFDEGNNKIICTFIYIFN